MSIGGDASQQRLHRQRERTVDNIKWLFAYVFAISFTIAAKNIFDALEPLLRGGRMSVPGNPWLYGEILVVFTVTASVFYYQGAKFFDWRYASGINDEAHPIGFAIDFATLVVTMAPFVLMANALDVKTTSAVGFTAFVFGYVVLIAVGLCWLLLFEGRHSKKFRRLLKEELSVEELQRDDALRTYWFAMNGMILALVVSLFVVARWFGVSCPAKPTVSDAWFLVAFGVIAIARDALDFFWAWPILYPVSDEDRTPMQPLRYLMPPGLQGKRWPKRLAMAIGIFAVAYALWQGVLNYGALVASCR